MKKHINVGVAIALMLLAAMLTFVMTILYYYNYLNNSTLTNTQQEANQFRSLIEMDKLVRRYYIGDIDEDALMDGILQGYMDGLGDPYGMYMNKEQYESYSTAMSGQFEGIGIRVIRDDSGYARIVGVMEGSPAELAGVLPDDIIISVAGDDALELGYYAVISALLGKEGTRARFTVARGADYAETEDFAITRAIFDTKSVIYRMLDESIGYIRFTEFNKTTLSEFELALSNLENHGALGIIFDVRHNGGGELNAIANVLDLLLPEGPILHTRDVENRKETIMSEKGELELPMVVLIDEETYSAAELFAAALRDYEKATLVGMKTYGKGMMQTIVPMGDVGGALDLSFKYYDPPYGENYEGTGVSPDIEVKLDSAQAALNFDSAEVESDSQLSSGVEEMLRLMEEFYPSEEPEDDSGDDE